MNVFNPAVALVAALLYSLGVSFVTFEWIYCIPLVYIVYIQRHYFLAILKKLLFLNLFIFVLFLVVWYESGLSEALNIYLRANAIILFNIALFFHSQGYDIVRGLYLLHFPRVVISSMYFTLKMIHFLNNDFKQLKTTLKARGFKAQSSLFTYETFGNMLGLLFVKSLRKAHALQNTFILRGFQGMIYLNADVHISRYDYILSTLLVGVVMIKVLI